MIIKPKIRGFICTTAHPLGCAEHVREQIAFVRAQRPIEGVRNALVIGSSTGYGLASRITAAFGANAGTIGVCFEKPASGNRTATAGWYNTAAFEREAKAHGVMAATINGDAFSDAVKTETIAAIRKTCGQVDLVIYSLASPRRVHPRTGEMFSSVLKPIGRSFSSKTVDIQSGVVTEATLDPATEDDIRHTAAVMGGEDWSLWIEALDQAGALAQGAVTAAYSYVGPELTHAVYREGTIGRAKDDLEDTALTLDARLELSGGRAFVSINKAVVTQSSSAIPVVPLYISLLFRAMKERGLHEGCIEQMYRLFAQRVYSDAPLSVDDRGRVRMDDWEMRADVQAIVDELWQRAQTDSLADIADLDGYREDFLKLFGFGFRGVDYDADVSPDVSIPSVAQVEEGV
ncbi:MAG: enoyl-ACP reductase FabV [Bacilli bacterium]